LDRAGLVQRGCGLCNVGVACARSTAGVHAVGPGSGVRRGWIGVGVGHRIALSGCPGFPGRIVLS
jgi:hypothetical protein